MITGQFLTTETPEGLMDIYVASPETSNKLPVVIVLQEAFGVNHHIQSVCQRFAKEGYLAVAPELFHRKGRRIEIEYTNRQEIMPLLGSLKNDEIIHDVVDTIEFLKTLPTANPSDVSTVGFCVGGFASALCATKIPLRKMIAFYGGGMIHERPGIGLHPILNDLKKLKVPALFFFGGQDASIPPHDVKMLETTLKEAHAPFELEVFPNSDHGFFCDERKVFNQVDASVAWKKTLHFLKS